MVVGRWGANGELSVVWSDCVAVKTWFSVVVVCVWTAPSIYSLLVPLVLTAPAITGVLSLTAESETIVAPV